MFEEAGIAQIAGDRCAAAHLHHNGRRVFTLDIAVTWWVWQ